MFLWKILFFLVLALAVNCQSHDETIMERTKGKDVVDSTLNKIKRSGIFASHPDQGFLRRLAYVESEFAENNRTYRPNYYGGAWQVDNAFFVRTKNHYSSNVFKELYAGIEEKFGIIWNSVGWQELQKPLYSALAARMYFVYLETELTPIRKIPGTIAAQAAFWTEVYRDTGDAARFVDEVNQLESEQECQGTLDVCMVMDASGSIGSQPFELAKDLAINLVNTFTLDPVLGTRVAFLTYGNSINGYFGFDNEMSKPEMVSALGSVIYTGGGTPTAAGLLRGLDYFEAAAPRPGIPSIMVTFTDGVSNSYADVVSAVETLQASPKRIISFAVAIGSAVQPGSNAEREMRTIAYEDPANVIFAADYEAFVEFFGQLNQDFCQMPQTPEFDTPTDGNINQGERRYYEVPLPDEGITVTIMTGSGRFKGYYSYSEINPNPSIHDGTFDSTMTHIAYELVDRKMKNVGKDVPTKVYITVEGDSGEDVPTEYSFNVEVGNMITEPTTEESTTVEVTTEITTEEPTTEAITTTEEQTTIEQTTNEPTTEGQTTTLATTIVTTREPTTVAVTSQNTPPPTSIATTEPVPEPTRSPPKPIFEISGGNSVHVHLQVILVATGLLIFNL